MIHHILTSSLSFAFLSFFLLGSTWVSSMLRSYYAQQSSCGIIHYPLTAILCCSSKTDSSISSSIDSVLFSILLSALMISMSLIKIYIFVYYILFIILCTVSRFSFLFSIISIVCIRLIASIVSNHGIESSMYNRYIEYALRLWYIRKLSSRCGSTTSMFVADIQLYSNFLIALLHPSWWLL